MVILGRDQTGWLFLQRKELDPNGDVRLRESYHEKMYTMLKCTPRAVVDIGCATGLSTFGLHQVVTIIMLSLPILFCWEESVELWITSQAGLLDPVGNISFRRWVLPI